MHRYFSELISIMSTGTEVNFHQKDDNSWFLEINGCKYEGDSFEDTVAFGVIDYSNVARTAD